MLIDYLQKGQTTNDTYYASLLTQLQFERASALIADGLGFDFRSGHIFSSPATELAPNLMTHGDVESRVKFPVEGGEGVENVLDDILEGHTGDDDFQSGDIPAEEPPVEEERPVTPVKKVRTGTPRTRKVKKAQSAAAKKAAAAKAKIQKEAKEKAAKKEEDEEEADSIQPTADEDEAVEEEEEVEPVKEEKVSPPKKVKKTSVKTEQKQAKESTSAKGEKSPKKKTKSPTKTPKAKVTKSEGKRKKTVPSGDGEEGEDGQNVLDDKLNLMEEGEEVKPQASNTENMDAQDYDTRSEAGSSDGFESSFDEESDESDMENDGEGDGDKEVKKKKKKRAISPIEWDRKTEEKSEEEEIGEEEDAKSDKSAKSEESARRQSSKLKYVFRSARFFLIKSNNHENVALAKAKGVWSTPPQNEIKLNNAIKSCSNVILIFSVRESGKFQGFARIDGESTKDHPPIRWVLPQGLSARALSGVFKLDWINRRELSFTKTSHLHNAWNDNKPVKIGRDGQEVEPRCGETLCRMFPSDDNVDVYPIAKKARKALHASGGGVRPAPPPPRDFDRRRGSFIRGGRRGDFHRRRPFRDNFYDPRRKRSRDEMEGNRGGFYKDRRMERSPRYAGVRRETFINGSYNDYIREFAHSAHSRAPPPPIPPYGPPPPGFGMEALNPYAGHYEQRPREYIPTPDFGLAQVSRARAPDKRSYERDVDDFLRRTTEGSSSRRRRHSSGDRDRDRSRERDRDHHHRHRR
ncbi:hypothetical protein FSP39_014128 [Pinctada imbricata]|uniref:YTH domain-containing protein n=1 Tax=Pinctada imbricata TaxID=66713 RepID=A0AA88XUS8_PINIB|nr:hypothetical protein FSP39_014128 [Pinctada imbricata]